MVTKRVYSDRTLKLLFGTASSCAYPTCEQPVIYSDRGLLTPVAEIAHIRSESPGGPRHDPDYHPDKIDMFENLLLLCPLHHHVVDYHHTAYPASELLAWKAAQASGVSSALLGPSAMAQVLRRVRGVFDGTTADDLKAFVDGRAILRLVDRSDRTTYTHEVGNASTKQGREPEDELREAKEAAQLARICFPLSPAHAVLPRGQRCRDSRCSCKPDR